MSDAYLGIVPLVFEGRTVPLSFTLRRVAKYGRDGLVSRLALVTEGGEGDGQALAELLELASGGEIKADSVIDRIVGLDATVLALHQAWSLARFGPSGRPEDQREANPLKRLWTSLSTLWRRGPGRA